jgi:hypothetical protein
MWDFRLQPQCSCDIRSSGTLRGVDCVWNVMAHAQKPDFIFRRKGRVHLNRRGSQFSRLLAADVCASAVVMLDTTRCELLWRVLATHSIRQFPLNFPSRESPCAITFQLDSMTVVGYRRFETKHSQSFQEDCLALEDRASRFFRNFCKLQIKVMWHPKIGKATTIGIVK